MEDDQQFCLRWNNHQSTLISVFDTLLENQTLVDCTLAAEGKFLKAHKVVLSACSPFFATLLQQQYDKHPIFILKDVKYQELRAMMDYMYRGEVNISQDQLAALLKAAESLQIKGLSDNRSGSTPKTDHHRGLNVPGSGSCSKLGGYTLEQTQAKRARAGPSSMEMTDISGSREGSSSPSRRRRKVRRRSVENAMSEVHDSSNSSQIQASQPTLQQQAHQQQQQSNANLSGVGSITAATSSLALQIPVSASSLAAGTSGVLAATGSIVGTQQGATQQLTTNITKKTESVKATGTSDAVSTENVQAVGVAGIGDDQNMEHVQGEKSNHKQKSSTPGGVSKETAELVIEPKSEYEEEGNEEPVEDLTLDDEEMGMEDLDQNAGTSQAGEGSSQGYAPWQHDRSQDELLLATQESQQRDPQDSITTDSTIIISSKYNLRRMTRSDVAVPPSSCNKGKGAAGELPIEQSTKRETRCMIIGSSPSQIEGDSNLMASSPSKASVSTAGEKACAPLITNNPTALIALQQLASISSVQSLERIMPTLRKSLLVNTDSLYLNRAGKLPRQSSKRLSQFETNRCPLCSRVYRSQAFLNEHMRKEHSVLI